MVLVFVRRVTSQILMERVDVMLGHILTQQFFNVLHVLYIVWIVTSQIHQLLSTV
jgi:hypothetical protein